MIPNTPLLNNRWDQLDEAERLDMLATLFRNVPGCREVRT